MKWLRLKYWWLWNIAVQSPLTVFSALSLLLIALSGPAKCFEPRPHPVRTETRGASERVRHTAVSGWVCCTYRPIHFGDRGAFQVVVCVVSYLSQDSAILLLWRRRWLAREQMCLQALLNCFMSFNCLTGVLLVFNSCNHDFLEIILEY